MGVTLSTARLIAPLSFVFDFASQQYGILVSSPTMKQVHDKYPAAFSPNPFFIGGFFGPQQIIQLLWLRELFRSDGQVESCVTELAPWYALGNACIGIWQFFVRNAEQMKAANYCVIVNTVWSLYWVYFRRVIDPTTWQQKLTNIVGITFAGIGVLDLLHNGSIAYFQGQAPNTLIKASTLIGMPLIAYASPVLMGACLAYDQLAIAVGQYQLAQKALDGYGGGGGLQWAQMMGIGAVVTAGVTTLKYLRTRKVL